MIDKQIRYSPDLLAQEYIEGPEYTVSVVCDENNTVHAVVPKEIILKEGQTKLAVTRRNEKIDALCRRIAEVMNPCGPFNVQLRVRDGEPYVFEINPRFSGTVNLTIAAGCDEVGGLIELAMGRPYTFGEWREGVVLVRQSSDAVMTEEDFNNRAPRRWDD
jgi:carbamoyl-phosphate synthase large subunit